MSLPLSDLFRRVQNLIGLGTISEVDHFGARVRVDINGRSTAWLPVPAEIGANFRRWRPLRVGTQVVVACPSGDPVNAVIVQILYSDAFPPPSTSGAVDIVLWDDGTRIEYDAAAKTMTIHSASNMKLTAVDALVLDAKDIEIHTGEEGRYLVDHHGRATQITHKGGSSFESDGWTEGSTVNANPDQGFSPPRVDGGGE